MFWQNIFPMRAFYYRAESFFGGKVDVLVNNAGVSPVLPFDTVMKVHIRTLKDVCLQRDNMCRMSGSSEMTKAKPEIQEHSSSPSSSQYNYSMYRWTLTGCYMERNCFLRSRASNLEVLYIFGVFQIKNWFIWRPWRACHQHCLHCWHPLWDG